MLNRIRAGGAVVVGEPHAAPGDVEIGAVAHGVAQTKPGAAGKILGAAEAEAAGVGPAEGPQRRLRNMVAWAMAAGPVAPTSRLPRASAKGSGRCWRCGASEARALASALPRPPVWFGGVSGVGFRGVVTAGVRWRRGPGWAPVVSGGIGGAVVVGRGWRSAGLGPRADAGQGGGSQAGATRRRRTHDPDSIPLRTGSAPAIRSRAPCLGEKPR
jgi:hypothetical protein